MKTSLFAAAMIILLIGGSSAVRAEQETEQRLQALEQKVESIEQQSTPTAAQKLTLGGYGELHANLTENGSKLSDPHRFVLYIGYDFADWVKFNSEVEIEHGYVEEGNGELSLEQANFDFLLSDRMNFRAGRLLAPIGIINERHEPTTFYSVERPAVDTVVIPSTWALDGVGVFGNLSSTVKYEAYLTNGLNAAGFSGKEGIRGGRMKERPGLSQLAASGRIDAFLAKGLRVGGSFFAGGANNGNKGVNPGLDVDVQVYAADAQYTLGKLEFRGEFARVNVDGAANLAAAGVGSAIQGCFLEGAWHAMPDNWKSGRLADADIVLFARYDKYDTQFKVPVGVVKDPANDRNDLTFGVAFFPVSNMVLKADYVIKKSAGADPKNQANLGIGWQF